MKLYGYWRSSAAYRVRITLHLKNVAFESIPVHLVKGGGEQHQTEYTQINPTHLVPTLVDEDFILNQSLAILDYIETKFPEPSIYPQGAREKATVQALSLDVACEIHPLNNLRVQQYLVKELGVSEEDKLAWSHYWMAKGFMALETKLKETAGQFCYGDQISLADISLVPQVYNAKRFLLDMSAFPIITRIVDNCNEHPAFIAALPENQADAT